VTKRAVSKAVRNEILKRRGRIYVED
jgi:hypothetical protein